MTQVIKANSATPLPEHALDAMGDDHQTRPSDQDASTVARQARQRRTCRPLGGHPRDGAAAARTNQLRRLGRRVRAATVTYAAASLAAVDDRGRSRVRQAAHFGLTAVPRSARIALTYMRSVMSV
jgi:hypothetical protein